MKKNILPYLVLTIISVLITSCSREDDADVFVGVYNINTTTTATWGGVSNTYSYSGTLSIIKVSASRVKTQGWFNTYGDVNGNTIYFEPSVRNSSDYSVTETYNAGTLNGNVLTFSSVVNGIMRSNGTWYNYSSYSYHKGIKQ